MNIPQNTYDVKKHIEKENETREMLTQAVVDHVLKTWNKGIHRCEISCTEGSACRTDKFELPDGSFLRPTENMMLEIAQEFNKKGYFTYDVDASNQHGRWRIFYFSQYPLKEGSNIKRI